MAIITGGDSGMGAATAIAFAKEGADVVIPYYYTYESEDAYRTKCRIEQLGRQCMLIVGDLREQQLCQYVIDQTFNQFGKVDILVNHHGVQFSQDSLLDIPDEQWMPTFKQIAMHFLYDKRRFTIPKGWQRNC